MEELAFTQVTVHVKASYELDQPPEISMGNLNFT